MQKPQSLACYAVNAVKRTFDQFSGGSAQAGTSKRKQARHSGECWNCGKIGHKKINCPNKLRPSQPSQPQNREVSQSQLSTDSARSSGETLQEQTQEGQPGCVQGSHPLEEAAGKQNAQNRGPSSLETISCVTSPATAPCSDKRAVDCKAKTDAASLSNRTSQDVATSKHVRKTAGELDQDTPSLVNLSEENLASPEQQQAQQQLAEQPPEASGRCNLCVQSSEDRARLEEKLCRLKQQYAEVYDKLALTKKENGKIVETKNAKYDGLLKDYDGLLKDYTTLQAEFKSEKQMTSELEETLATSERLVAENAVGASATSVDTVVSPVELDSCIVKCFGQLRAYSGKVLFQSIKKSLGKDAALNLRKLVEKDDAEVGSPNVKLQKALACALVSRVAFENFECEKFEASASCGLQERADRCKDSSTRYEELQKQTSEDCLHSDKAFYTYCHRVNHGLLDNLCEVFDITHEQACSILHNNDEASQELLTTLKYIWELHTLAFAFEVPVEIIRVGAGYPSLGNACEPVDDSDEESAQKETVARWVLPGFRLCGYSTTWKCKVISQAPKNEEVSQDKEVVEIKNKDNVSPCSCAA
ncbi:hypothetical protein CYMTET_33127 [Cymbomonas tetramitiformis]|uniref:CCHC-type domain-containing protein n=1 Tax=Cymbomonas tetramitiformis TaxID=36881 RepID=A0AAE0FDJ8_9CHLO|nr:hypothetical protein CYMTET_33127 [Cymbomonas tetramitiformis]